MAIIIYDESAVDRLSAAAIPSEVYTSDGRLLGRFIPASKKMSFPEFGMTDEELDARAGRPDATWYSTDEVMARLRELTKDS